MGGESVCSARFRAPVVAVAGLPRNEFGSASVISTGMKSPTATPASALKFTVRLLLVLPRNSPGSRRERPSTSTISVLPTMRRLISKAWRLMVACRCCRRSSFS